MADKPIREQSALELLETHAKALEADNARLRAVAVAAKALVRTVERTHSLTLDVEIVSEPALTTLESTLAAAGYDMSDEELEQRLAHETESKPPREIWACVSKGISPPYVRFFESKAEMEAYEWRDDSVSPNRYRPAVETAALPTSEGTCTCPPHLDPLGCAAKTCPRAIAARAAEKAAGDRE